MSPNEAVAVASKILNEHLSLLSDLTNLDKNKKIALIVGSEGGFSDKEIQQIYNAGATNFGLGSRILRAETAAISISSIVGYLVGV